MCQRELAQSLLMSQPMKTLTAVIPLLLTLPLACGGTVESESSKNDGVIGAAADPNDSATTSSADAEPTDADDDSGTTGTSADVEPDDDDPGTTGTSVDVEDDGTELASAIALTRAQLDALYAAHPEFGTSGSTTGATPDLNPEDLFLEVSDLGPVCTASHTHLSCGGHWSLTIALPPVHQTVGVYDLADLQYSSMSETTEPNSPQPDDCGFGGGTFLSGTIEVLA